jgi:hypothetical protein
MEQSIKESDAFIKTLESWNTDTYI